MRMNEEMMEKRTIGFHYNPSILFYWLIIGTYYFDLFLKDTLLKQDVVLNSY